MSAQSPPPPSDWQTTKCLVKERGKYLLETGIWSDCRFIVGSEPNQQFLEGHKLFLAMSSPVFEAMFFGGMAEKDPIAILDVQPDAFKALLEYIYTDRINLVSFDQACELCYAAKKYMLPDLVEQCTRYLWSALYPRNACRAYEFAKLFEEPILRDKCLNIMRNQTQEVLTESSFEEVELSTIITLLDQDELNINSELDLFHAVCQYAARHVQNAGGRTPRLEGIGNASDEEASANHPTIRDALTRIRFLTLTPQEFAEGTTNSNLLTQTEKYAILMNICTPNAAVSMPEGFSISTAIRRKLQTIRLNEYMKGGPTPMDTLRPSLLPYNLNQSENTNDASKKLYCDRQLLGITDYMNRSGVDCAVTFTTDRNVCVYGIEIPAQIPSEEDCRMGFTSSSTYTELVYAHLTDADGSRLTYTHFSSRVGYRSLIEISFNRPIYIQRNKAYKVGVVLNKTGCYPLGTYPPQTLSHGVVFNFSVGHCGSCGDSVRDGLIRSIIFSIPPNHNSHPNMGNIPGDSSRMNTVM